MNRFFDRPVFPKQSSKLSTQSENQLTSAQQSRKQPIPPPSNPEQYRAIGLIRGKYEISSEKINRGFLTDCQGKKIRVVLLSRVISLIRSHLDLSKEHLWVVYPRTKLDTGELHLQVVGVWEPKTLHKTSSSQILDGCEGQNRYFSIRGEVISFNRYHKIVIVKIKQKPKEEFQKPKFFRLKLHGTLPEKCQGHFWDLHVQLETDKLVIQKGTDLGLLPKHQKRKPVTKPKLNQPVQENQAKKQEITLRRSKKVSSRKPKPI